MPILIPSKNIYQVENPKVRDNVIDRIEVSTVEVVPNSKYEDSAYNEMVSVVSVEELGEGNDQIVVNYDGTIEGALGDQRHRLSVSYAGYLQKKVTHIDIYVPFLKDNKLIKNIRKNQPVSCNIYGDVTTGVLSAGWQFVIGDPETGLGNFPAIERKRQELNRLSSSTTKNMLISFEENILVEEKSQELYVSSEASLNLNKWGNVDNPPVEKDNQQQYYKISLSIPAGLLIETASGSFVGKTNVVPDGDRAKIKMDGEFILYEVKNVEVTAYGDTIGINLTDKTFYIPENDKTSKKSFSFDGNELMQTSNYLLDSGEKSIETMYESTRSKYLNGKETATVRCSISDYYKYGQLQSLNSIAKSIKRQLVVTENVKATFSSIVVSSTITVELKNGIPFQFDTYVNVTYKTFTNQIQKRTILIKKGNTTAKATVVATNIQSIQSYSAYILVDMVFKEHDKVVPMVFGADGQDKPLSVYKDGTPKVFNVLGVEFLYDGAVWQILNLQEE